MHIFWGLKPFVCVQCFLPLHLETYGTGLTDVSFIWGFVQSLIWIKWNLGPWDSSSGQYGRILLESELMWVWICRHCCEKCRGWVGGKPRIRHAWRTAGGGEGEGECWAVRDTRRVQMYSSTLKCKRPVKQMWLLMSVTLEEETG